MIKEMLPMRTRLIAGLAIAAVASFFVGIKFYGYVKNHFFAAAPIKKLEVDDLYNARERLFKRGRRDLNEVCLTIDDGPHPSLHRILPILKQYGVKATFFMVGMRIKSSPQLVREVLAEGHEIGNHTQTHQRLDQLTPDQMRAEIAECEDTFEKATGGLKMTLFRPPGMRFTPDLLKIAREFNYTTVDWNYGAKDFVLKSKGHPVTVGEGHIAEFVLKQVTPGGIILLHDSDDTADALPQILEGLRAKGLAVKNVTQMLADLPTPVYVESNAGGAVATHHRATPAKL